MSNVFDDMRTAMQAARDTLRAADYAADGMADMLRRDGRLRQVDPDYLRELKSQLQQFNAITGRWKASV